MKRRSSSLSPTSLLEVIGLRRILRVPQGAEEWFAFTGFLIVLFIISISILAPFISPYDPTKPYSGPALQPPSFEYPFGTNLLGMDMLSRIIWGGRFILLIALASATFSMIIGTPLGLISGYFGGKLDRVLSVIMDSIYAFPGLILAIALTAMLGPSMLNVIVAISVIYIPTFFRMVRSVVLSVKEEAFVEAGRALGASSFTIIFRYIFPSTLPNIVVIFSLCVADAILTEAGLAFIGLSPISPPTPDWGYDLYAGWQMLIGGYWWLVLFPGIFITLTVLGFALIGEGLNELYNPLLRER